MKKRGLGCLFVFVFLFLFIGLIGNLINPENKNTVAELNIEQAKPYEVLNLHDISFAGRDRYKAHIYAPEAVTYEQRAHTAMKAAKEICLNKKAHFVSALLEPSPALAGKGDIVAMADYAVDGRGVSGEEQWTWNVQSSRSEVTAQQIADAEIDISLEKYELAGEAQ
jgi:hypothetical protein